jgi:hypothetical protein
MTLRRAANTAPCTPQEAPAPTVRAESPPPAEEPDESYTGDDILAFVREMAATNDPRRAPIYRAVEPERIRAGARLAQQILETHLELRQRMGRRARTGRRKHAQSIYQLLDSTNDADLELAVAALSIPCYFATRAQRGD